MMWSLIFAGFLGYVAGHQVAKGKAKDLRRRLRERLDDAEGLLQMLEGYVLAAKANGNRSEMVEYADTKITAYKRRWIK